MPYWQEYKERKMEKYIKPGEVWLDTKGERIEAHGGSMFYEEGTYYWYGEDKSHTRKKGKTWTWGVKCYSSQDLVNWKDLGHIIEPVTDDKKSLFYPERRLDRPHIIKNKKTNKYVMWLKYNDKAHFAILSSDSLLGPYKLENPFFQPDGRRVGDFDLVSDPNTGEGYLYVDLDHTDLVVYKLSDDYLSVTGEKANVYSGLKPPFSREGVTYFIHNGKHYLLTSGMIGYVPNPSEVAVSDDYMGPFKVLGNPHVNDESSASFNSQASSAFRVEGRDTIVVMADRWVPDYVMTKEKYDAFVRAIYSRFDKTLKPKFRDMWMMLRSPMMGSADTSKANYVWLPVEWKGDMPQIMWREKWNLAELEKNNE